MRSVLFWVAAAAVSTAGEGHWRFTVAALSMKTTSTAAPFSAESAPTRSFSATTAATTSRRRAIGWIASTVTATVSLDGGSSLCRAAEPVDRFNVEDYLKTGMVMNPMGVSGQAGA
jgi:hypothetical protein